MHASHNSTLNLDCLTQSQRTSFSQNSKTYTPSRSLSPESVPKLNNTSRRSSVFFEVGLGGEDAIVDERMRREDLHIRSHNSEIDHDLKTSGIPPAILQRPAWGKYAKMTQLLLVTIAIAVIWPGLPFRSALSSLSPPGAEAVPLQSEHESLLHTSKQLNARETSPTDVCKRWAHMSAVVNGTLYIYGGQATTTPDQTENTWNNNFLSLDLTKTWGIASPSLTGLPRPSGPPSVALGVLWNDMQSLYLYGGEYSWQPAETPDPFSLWSYSIKSQSWAEHSNPKDTAGQAIQRAAEGAGVSVPGLGRGYYLGGHLDGYTTSGWSQSIPRVYLQSTIEYTMPGVSNAAISSTSPTSNDGAYRNISATNAAGFPLRADGALVYVPGYGASGILVGLAGGTSTSFTQMNILDVYDIATSSWSKQSTSGSVPKTRVNPCVVAVSAADGSSTQIHMYGGQNLQPAGNQTQYDDMWILTVPSFTWIEVDQTGQSTPPARAGHSCNVWNGQMIVVGGYVGQDLSCDSPGIYVFNTSALSWQNQYKALDTKDPLNRQSSQVKDNLALQGSYGYEVPSIVQRQIGGGVNGAATVTAPAQQATQGPLVSGKPVTYTVTNSNGATMTQTASPGTTTDGSSNGANNSSGGSNKDSSSNAGAIAAGVVAGLLAILAAYLGFCAYLYRKQLQLYKHHVAMVQHERLSDEANRPFMGGGAAGRYNDKDRASSKRPGSSDQTSGTSGDPGRSSNSSGRRMKLNSNNPYNQVNGGTGYATAASSTEDLMNGQEPSFLGVMLNPRRSLRVMNRD